MPKGSLGYLIASGVELTRRALAGQEISMELREAAFHGLGRMLSEAAGMDTSHPLLDRQIGELMASDSWIARVAEAVAAS